MPISRVFYPAIVGIIALSVFGIYQMNTSSLEQKITDSLHQIHGLKFKQTTLSYFPTPHLILSNPEYHDKHWVLSAEQLDLEFSWRSLLGFVPKVTQLSLSGGELRASASNFESINRLHNIAVRLDNIEAGYHQADLNLSANSADSDQLQLVARANRFANGVGLHNVRLTLEMAQGTLLNNRMLTLQSEALSLSKQQVNQKTLWQLVLQQAQLNDLLLQKALIHYYPSANTDFEPHFQAKLEPQQGGQFNVDVSLLEENRLRLSGQKLALEPLLVFLQLPTLLGGTVDFDGEAVYQKHVLAQGRVHLHVTDGALNGLDLLDLISQYYPIRQGAKHYTDRLKTPFEYVDMGLNWDKGVLSVQQIEAYGKDLKLNGKGEITLADFNCRFQGWLASTNSAYSQYQLPISLFGPCRSPQYQINLDRTLGKQQLKQLLKEKLKEKY